MATTARYIVSNVNATNGSFLDLGIQGRALSDPNSLREIIYYGGTTTTERVYLRSGVTLDFATKVGTGARTVYLDGNYANYTFDTSVSGQLTLTRGSGATLESLKVLTNATTTLVFANGSAATDAANLAVGTATLGTATSGALTATGIAGMTQNLRVITYDGGGEAMAVARAGTTYTTTGGVGVDSIYVERGAKVTAIDLGAGTDKIYLTRNFADYDVRTLSGLTITLGHTASGESVTFSASQGANSDSLVFADGAMGTEALRLAFKAATAASSALSTVTTAGVTGFDAATTTTIYTPGSVSNFALVTDTAAADGITSNGAVSFARAAGDAGDSLQYRVKTGGTFGNWVDTTSSSFTLDAQASGAVGRQYNAGDVEVRQVSASGVQGTAVANTSVIVVDNVSNAPGLGQDAALRYTYRPASSDNQNAETSFGSAAAGSYTVEVWAKADATSAFRQQIFYFRHGSASVQLGIKNGGELYAWTGSDATETNLGFTVQSGVWNHYAVSYDSTATTGNVKITVNGGNSTLTTSTRSMSTAHGVSDIVMVGDHEGTGIPRALNGQMAELKMWSTVRTTVEILADMTNVPTGTETNLAAYFKMDELSGTPANSVTGGPTMTVGVGATQGDVITSAATGVPNSNLVGSAYTTSGTGAEVGATITVTLTRVGESNHVGTGVVQADGTWQVSVSGLTDAQIYGVSTTQTDRAGNVSSENTKNVTVVAGIPTHPVLASASDSGTAGDAVTNTLTPTITGVLPAGVAANAVVTLYNGTTQLATQTGTGTTGGLSVDTTAGTWLYTPGTDYANGDVIKFIVKVGNYSSPPLIVNIDTAVTAATLTSTLPTMVQSTSGDLVLSGALERASLAATVTLTDGATSTQVKVATILQNIDGTTSWSATFTQAELGALADGTVAATISVTDRAGNTGGNFATTQSFTLEVANAAPVATATVIPTLAISATATGTILNLADVDAVTAGVQPAFTDADAVGSTNGTLSYSGKAITGLGTDGAVGGGDDTYGALPTWLEVTSAGVVQVVAGQAPVAGTYNLHLTATDGAEATAVRDVTVSVSAGITLSNGAMQGGANLDLRTNAVLYASEDVNLVGVTAATGMTIKLVNLTTAGRDITLDLTNATDRAMVSITNGSTGNAIVINPAYDLDAGDQYRVEVSAGAFVATSGSSTSLALDSTNGITFTTINLSTVAAGASISADIWNAPDAITGEADWRAVTWHNLVGSGSRGTDGNGYTASKATAAIDAAGGEHVFYLGAITDAGSNVFTTATDSWAQVNNFGKDDRLYFDDQANSASTYGQFNVANSVGLSSYDEGTSGVDGNRATVSAASTATGGLWLDMTLDTSADNWASQTQNYAESWSGTTAPTFQSVYGASPVLVA